MQSKILTILLLSSLILVSCKDAKKSSFNLGGIMLTSEGPLLEGSVTAQSEIDLSKTLFPQGNISAANIESAQLSVPDSMNFDLIRSITLSMVSENSDMIKIGTINPVPKGQKSITLTMASDQEKILPILANKKFTMVADVDMAQDTNMNLNILSTFNFNLEIKE
jgi:hypothetical protein